MSASKPFAPKLRLIKDKQGAGLGGITIRFNAASLMDDDDDEIVLDTTTPNPPEEEFPSSGEGSRTKKKGLSLSPASSSRKSPSREEVFISAASSPVEETDKSLLSGIKERLHDPLTAFIGKIEEISGESGESSLR